MTGSIVVPLDGSELAERALPYALRLARAEKVGLVLLRVALADAPMTLDGANWERDQLSAVAEAERYLEHVQAGLDSDIDVVRDVPYGPAGRGILAAIQRLSPSAVVMATHGRTGLAHLVHGSVAEIILAGSEVPVWLVPAHADRVNAVPGVPAAPRVLVPLDGSPLSESALAPAIDYLGAHAGGALLLATVVAEPDHVERDEQGRVLAYLDQQEDALRRGAREYLEGVAARVRQKAEGVAVSAAVTIGSADEGIVALAAQHGVDAIVMATHARTGLERMRQGSVAGAVLQASDVPVLLVRAQTPAVARGSFGLSG